MTIQLNVTSELEQKLKKVASQMGLTPDTYIVRLLQKDFQNQLPSARRTNQKLPNTNKPDGHQFSI